MSPKQHLLIRLRAQAQERFLELKHAAVVRLETMNRNMRVYEDRQGGDTILGYRGMTFMEDPVTVPFVPYVPRSAVDPKKLVLVSHKRREFTKRYAELTLDPTLYGKITFHGA